MSVPEVKLFLFRNAKCAIVKHEGDNARILNPGFHLSLCDDLFPAVIQTPAVRWGQLLRERETDRPH